MKQEETSQIEEHIPPNWWTEWDFEKGEWKKSERALRLEEAFSWGCSDQAACTHARITIEMLKELQDCDTFDFAGWRLALKANLEIRARRTFAAELANNAKAAWEYLQVTDPALHAKTLLANEDGKPLEIRIIGADPDKLKL